MTDRGRPQAHATASYATAAPGNGPIRSVADVHSHDGAQIR
jgi:hypothetical protein